MATDYIHYLNNHSSKYDFAPISRAQLEKLYPKATQVSDGSRNKQQTATLSVHCECTLALRLLDELNQPQSAADVPGKLAGTIEIGYSKQTCHWCQTFLTQLAALKNVEIRVRRFHGKATADWRLPNAGPVVPARFMKQLLHEMALEILAAVGNKRRSDSTPTNLLPPDSGSGEVGPADTKETGNLHKMVRQWVETRNKSE